MTQRLDGKVAIVVGAGQTPGRTIGNGRATAILFAREGARVMLVDFRLDSALETQRMIEDEGGESFAFEADVTDEQRCSEAVRACVERYGRIDILHNNVGIGQGDTGPVHLTEETWDRITGVNMKSVLFMCKHVLPVMREQGGGVITNISSVAAIASTGLVAYKSSKAAVNAFTQALATGNFKHGIRANAILPGLMNTPMAVEPTAERLGLSVEEVIEARDKRVPLGGKMGTAWDVAYASLFLASDEARFITGVLLPVDGGQSVRVG
jgi:NAD(P)-dependent dehydrogenase (short-subunit alcohol dehydrogenase family)